MLHESERYRVATHGLIRTIYNMSGRVVSDIQTRTEGESLYIRYTTRPLML